MERTVRAEINVASRWIACVPGPLTALASLRLHPALECGTERALSWVRGGEMTDSLLAELRQIPGMRYFEVSPDGRMRRPGALLWDRRMPSITWSPLKQSILVARPAEVSASFLASDAELRTGFIADSGGDDALGEADALLTTLEEWHGFADHCSELRLRPLRFAVSSRRHVFVLGRPVPSIPGTRYRIEAGVALPWGTCTVPRLDSRMLRLWLEASDRITVVWMPEQKWSAIGEEQFVAATRAAVRRSAFASPPSVVA